MRTDGRTYMTKLIVAFCNFAKAPKMTIDKKVIEEINAFNYMGCSASCINSNYVYNEGSGIHFQPDHTH